MMRNGMNVIALVLFFWGCAVVPASAQEHCKSDPSTPAKIVFTSERDGNQEIYVMNPDGTEQTRLTYNLPVGDGRAGDGVDADPAWSPDRTQIAFLSVRNGRDAEIWIMNADGSNPRNLTNDPTRWDLEPEWSPDGRQIVYVSSQFDGRSVVPGTAEIFLINADGTNRRRLTDNNYHDAYPVFSPDGTEIVFHHDGDGDHEIFVMDINGNMLRQLTSNSASDRGCSWSPDGSKLVFTSDRTGDGEIYLMDPDGANVVQLTHSPGPDANPSFSPDGTRIVFQSMREGVGGGPDLFVMDLDGGNVTRLTINTVVEKDPDWVGGCARQLLLRVNGDASPTVKASNPVTVEYAIRGGQGQEFFLVLDALVMGISWSYRTAAGTWVPLPANLADVTPFTMAPGDGDYMLYAGAVPAGVYTLCLGYDQTVNGHLDMDSVVYDCATVTVQ